MSNIGWKFYKEYYRNLESKLIRASSPIDEAAKIDYEKQNNELVSCSITDTLKAEIEDSQIFMAATTYPGLLIGSGYQHETGGEKELKIGFYFDYSTGLPQIPGSSIKGLIRSYFPFHKKDLGERFRNARIGYLKNEIKAITGLEVVADDIERLEKEIFEGVDYTESDKPKKLAIYQRDKFFDAIISNDNEKGKVFLGTDYITPHKEALKNPVPIPFLKVLPSVLFLFQFRLQNSKAIEGITMEHKLALFKSIILENGIGAKTNVGYGQLEEKVKSIKVMNFTEEDLEIINFKNDVEKDIYKAKVTGKNERRYLFQLENGIALSKNIDPVHNRFKRRSKKIPELNGAELIVGDEVFIRITDSHSKDKETGEVKPNFSVYHQLEGKPK